MPDKNKRYHTSLRCRILTMYWCMISPDFLSRPDMYDTPSTYRSTYAKSPPMKSGQDVPDAPKSSRLIPLWVQFVFFLAVAVFLYLVFSTMETNETPKGIKWFFFLNHYFLILNFKECTWLNACILDILCKIVFLTAVHSLLMLLGKMFICHWASVHYHYSNQPAHHFKTH